MRALIFDKELKYRTDYPDPEPETDEALIRITYAGICNTDMEIIRGYMGFEGILGHEFVGIVEKCSENSMIGQRVVGEINLGCGRCSYCRNQMENHCPDRLVLGILNKDGVFADYATLPVRNLHKIPNSLSDVEAVFIEPLAAAYEILVQVNITSSDKVCVLGDGKLGLLVAQALASTKCSLTAVGNHEAKLSMLAERGIKTSLRVNFTGKEFDVVIDCTGSLSGITKALEIVRPKGKVILKTTVAANSQIDLNAIVIHEISLIGSRCGPFPAAIEAISTGQVDLNPLIGGIYSLEDGIRAFQDASEKGTLKVILKVS
jgi:threonine dehydrogenase-like Zn-dependent dehydrogenase